MELYRALRRYVNFFQPSRKLKEKRQTGKAVQRVYLPAQTPFARRCAAEVLAEDVRARMEALFFARDPVRLLDQIGQLQTALWSQTVVKAEAGADQGQPVPVRFVAEVCGLGDGTAPTAGVPPLLRHQKRAYKRQQRALPRWWRTRADPFATVWTEIEEWLEAAPTRTANSIFAELQQRYPAQYPDVQLRTLQRRIATWRTTMVTTFDDHWLQEEVLATTRVPRPLGVVKTPTSDAERRCAGTRAGGWRTSHRGRLARARVKDILGVNHAQFAERVILLHGEAAAQAIATTVPPTTASETS